MAVAYVWLLIAAHVVTFVHDMWELLKQLP